jgi:DNA-binding NtrC family response regulator
MKEKILIVEDEFVEANYLRSMLNRAGYTVCGVARSVEKALELVEQERPGLVLLDITLSGKLTGVDLARQLKEQNIAFIYLSANSTESVLTEAKATEPYGFLVKPFRENDLLITLEIARYRHKHSLESKYRQEALLQNQLAAIGSTSGDWEQRLLAIGKALQPYIPFDFLTVAFDFAGESGFKGLGFLRVGFDEYQSMGVNELSVITGMKVHELDRLYTQDFRDTAATIYTEDVLVRLSQSRSLKKLMIDTFEMGSCLTLPLHISDKEQATLLFFSRRPDIYNSDHVAIFYRIQQSLTKSLKLALPQDRTRLSSGSATKHKERPSEDRAGAVVPGFEGIIGKSHLLLSVFDGITQVAPSDTSVLILGESGTGKEMIASCIHKLSPRKDQRLVKVNCAAIPPTLIESELFGHEKGSFTGALDKRIGKFEQADKGTIFLDEVGEMPLELQAKLLTVLQDREIERIGARAPIKINVRIIAATNRNLEKEVAEGRFRLDLYYRLNVFPITLPPLRDRKEDLLDLANFFIGIYNRKAGRKITGLSDGAYKSMMAYHWPGNVRELEHLIERCVLLAKGSTIDDVPIPTPAKNDPGPYSSDYPIKTIQQNERDHIITVLRKCNGKIWGPGAAAELLNLPPTTLRSKMKKLGIEKQY